MKLKRLITLLIFLVGGSILIACQPGNTYYVSPSGNDRNPGSQSHPWKTIQKAAETMTAGDTVLIHAGTYLEKVIPANSGVEGKYITYQSVGDGQVTIDAQEGARSGCIEVSNKGYLRFIGLHLRNAGYQDLNAAFAAFPGSNHLILDGITAENSRFGIMLRGSKTASEDTKNVVSFVTIKNSIIRNNSAYGIFLYFKVTDSVIGPGNTIFNENAINGVPLDDQYGINLDTNYPGDPAHGPRRITIIGNEVYGNRIQGIRPWNAQDLLIQDNYTHHNGATGIQVEDGCANVVVTGNRSEYNAQSYEYESGIWIDSSDNVLVQNNTVRGNQIGLIVTSSNQVLLRNNIAYENDRAPMGSNSMGAVLNSNSSSITFVHNTLWHNGTASSPGNLSFCKKPPVTNTVIKNNIISDSLGEFDALMHCSVSSDFNNFSNIRELSVNWLGQQFRWVDYVTASGQDQHSLTDKPLFVNPSEGDFSLSEGSVNIDSASALTKTTAEGSGTAVTLEDVRYFSDGFGLMEGDMIRIGNQSVKVAAVDYQKNIVTVDQQITWNKDEPVSYVFSGASADRGAKEATLSIQGIFSSFLGYEFGRRN